MLKASIKLFRSNFKPKYYAPIEMLKNHSNAFTPKFNERLLKILWWFGTFGTNFTNSKMIFEFSSFGFSSFEFFEFLVRELHQGKKFALFLYCVQ